MFEGKKITKATVKSFVRKNIDNLHIKTTRTFDGMVDGCIIVKGGFEKVSTGAGHEEHTLGVKGVWLVNGSRDYFQAYKKDGFVGIEVYNCCGSFILAIKE